MDVKLEIWHVRTSGTLRQCAPGRPGRGIAHWYYAAYRGEPVAWTGSPHTLGGGGGRLRGQPGWLVGPWTRGHRQMLEAMTMVIRARKIALLGDEASHAKA